MVAFLFDICYYNHNEQFSTLKRKGETMNLFLELHVFQQGNEEEYKELIDYITYFWFTKHYSVFNSVLMYAQRPGAVAVETAHVWQRDYGRTLLPNASPIVILRPFGPIEFVYEYADTYGEKELYPSRPTYYKGNVKINGCWLSELLYNIQKAGIYYSEKNFGSGQGAELVYVKLHIN